MRFYGCHGGGRKVFNLILPQLTTAGNNKALSVLQIFISRFKKLVSEFNETEPNRGLEDICKIESQPASKGNEIEFNALFEFILKSLNG